MFLDTRCVKIFHLLLNSSNHVTPEHLAKSLKVSKRTIYYDMEKINHWLKSIGETEIKRVRGLGFHLDESTKRKVWSHLHSMKLVRHYDYSSGERKSLIALKILTRDQSVNLQKLQDEILVSRNTILNDIKDLKSDLRNFNLSLTFTRNSGYYMNGLELQKRKVIVNHISKLLITIGYERLCSELSNQNIESIKDLLLKSEDIATTRFTEDVIQTLSIYLSILIKRWTREKFVQMDVQEKQVLQDTEEYELARHLLNKVESVYELNLPNDECCYFTTYFLGSRRVDYKQIHPNNEILNLKDLVQNMIDEFQTYACVQFSERKNLEKNLLLHMKPAYYRLKYGIHLENELTQSIKDKYPDIFTFTKKVIHHFEKIVGKTINDDEIAYIAMHFGGWLKKEGFLLPSRKKVLIVCESGIGTSRILQKQLEDLLPNVDVIDSISIRDYKNYNISQLDFIVSTISLPPSKISIYKVRPILTPSDKILLLKEMNHLSENIYFSANSIIDIVKKHATIHNEQSLFEDLEKLMNQNVLKEENDKPMLRDLLIKQHINIVDEIDNWQKAIQLASEPLLDNGYITNDYINAMIDNVLNLGPYIVIAPQIALPHARPEQGVQKLGMSLLKVNNGCAFSESEEHRVNIIIVLAAIDNETHLKALSQLTKLLSSKENREALIKTNNIEEILQLVNEYSK